jgi:hypothetical protein
LAKEKPRLEFFIAHNHVDNDLASETKYGLEALGITTFMAPHNVPPSEQWRAEIFTHLATCTALIAIVTESFGQSWYAVQESAMVMGKEKPVIPLRFGEAKLPGFLESIQAIPATKETIPAALTKAVNFVKSKDPAFIRTGYIVHSEARRIALQDVKAQILWRGKDSQGVTVNDEDIVARVLKLNEIDKIYEMNGYAKYRFRGALVESILTWSITIDAVTGRILSQESSGI